MLDIDNMIDLTPNGDSTSTNIPTNAIEVFDSTKDYPDESQIEISDIKRPNFRTRYANNSGSTIPAGNFDENAGWTKLASYYKNAYGHGFTNTGLISGGKIEKGTGDNDIIVRAGNGIIVDRTDRLNPSATFISWNELNQTIDWVGGTIWAMYVFVDSTGNIFAKDSMPDASFMRDNIYLGSISRDYTSISTPKIGAIISAPVTSEDIASTMIDYFKASYTYMILNGLLIDEINGTMNLQMDAGSIGGMNINFHNAPNNPHALTVSAQNPIVFDYMKYNDPGFFALNGTNFDPTQWDDGGILKSVSATEATIQPIYYSILYNRFVSFYGIKLYANLQEAEDDADKYLSAFVPPESIRDGLIQLGYIIFTGGCTDLGDKTTAIVVPAKGATPVGSGAGAIDKLGDIGDVTLDSPITGSQYLRFNQSTNLWENDDVPNVFTVVNQPGHGFAPATPIWYNESTGLWEGALSPDKPAYAVVGTIDADNFYAIHGGYVKAPGHPFWNGYEENWYLHDGIAGKVVNENLRPEESQGIFRSVSDNLLFVHITETHKKEIVYPLEYSDKKVYVQNEIFTWMRHLWRAKDAFGPRAKPDLTKVECQDLGPGGSYARSNIIPGSTYSNDQIVYIQLGKLPDMAAGTFDISIKQGVRESFITMQFAINWSDFSITFHGAQDSQGVLEIIPSRVNSGYPIYIWAKYKWYQSDMYIDATIRSTNAQVASTNAECYEDPTIQTSQPNNIAAYLIPKFDGHRFFYSNSPMYASAAPSTFVYEIADNVGCDTTGNWCFWDNWTVDSTLWGKRCKVEVNATLGCSGGAALNYRLKLQDGSYNDITKIEYGSNTVRDNRSKAIAIWTITIPSDGKIRLYAKFDGESARPSNHTNYGQSALYITTLMN